MAQILEATVHIPPKSRTQLRREGLAAVFSAKSSEDKERSSSEPPSPCLSRAASADRSASVEHATSTERFAGKLTRLGSLASAKNVIIEMGPTPSTSMIKRATATDQQRQPADVDRMSSTGAMMSAELGGGGDGEVMPSASVASPSAGVICWKDERLNVMENAGKVTCVVERVGGSKGKVSVKYKSKDQSATAGKDYEHVEGELTFADGDITPKIIEIKIIDDDVFEKVRTRLFCPHRITSLGAAGTESTWSKLLMPDRLRMCVRA